jgi:N,N'-diacetylchitobiose phosphorylase
VHSQTTYATVNVNAGKSRVPWLTGTVSWSYFVAVQSILGIRPELDGLRIDPCIPSSWPGFECEREFRGKRITIKVTNPNKKCRGVTSLTVDGKKVSGNVLPLALLADGAVVEARLDG